MYRFLAIAFLFIAMTLAFWALDLQGKLVLKEKDLLMLRTPPTFSGHEDMRFSVICPWSRSVILPFRRETERS